MQPNPDNQVVKAALGDSVRMAHPYDLAVIGQIFSQRFEREPGVRLLLLSTADGRAVAHKTTLDADGRRLAAMANSFLTLGETLSRELSLGEADFATVCTRQGNVVLIRIRADKPLTLTAMGSNHTNMASLLYNARECAAQLETALRPQA